MRLAPIFQDLRDTPPPLEHALQTVVRTIVELHAREPRLHQVLTEEMPVPPDLRRLLHTVEEHFGAEIERYLRHCPEVTVEDPALAAHLLIHAVEGMVHQFVIYPRTGYHTAQIVDEIVTMLHRYLVSRR